MEYFDPTRIPIQALTGSNLIEASAGTGKTYSIALLVLRLIMEKDVPIDKILMVTYTNAAVAELSDRIRLFLALARRYASGESISDVEIAVLVDQAVAYTSLDEVSNKLKDAILLLDESMIVTIHSFCQYALSRYAFETGQLFDVELLSDIGQIVEAEVNHFWRTFITTLPTNLLELSEVRDHKGDLNTVIGKILQGRQYADFDPAVGYDFVPDNWSAELNQLNAMKNFAKNQLSTIYNNQKEDLFKIIEKKRNAKLQDARNNIDLLLEELLQLKAKNKSTYFDEFPFADELDNYIAVLLRIEEFKSELLRAINYFAVSYIPDRIRQQMVNLNVLTFDDLINNLYRTIVIEKNKRLIQKLRDDFSAVFIDEFQDTDNVQFQIFDVLFIQHPETITFLIGDPKQSIYAFRGADIETYLLARNKVNRKYTMNTNYRSSVGMVAAMNAFFLPKVGFPTFGYDAEGINYVEIDNADKNSTFISPVPISAIEITEVKNADDLNVWIVNKIYELLTADYKILEKDISRAIQPSDIGILVKSKYDGKQLKKLLDYVKIPAVIVNDDKVLQSETATDISKLLNAVNEGSLALIKTALFTETIGWNTDRLNKLDTEAILEVFRNYKSLWEDHSVYELLTQIKQDFQVEQRLVAKGGGLRVLSDFNQLTELLQKQESIRGLSAEEILNWLNKGRQGDDLLGDEYILQMENDEEAVRIVTIHKSKGLEYKIVFCPKLNLSTSAGNYTYVDFKNNNHYIFKEKNSLSEEESELYELQQHRENRRLIYVAVTRAVYKCFIVYSRGSKGKNSLSELIENLNTDRIAFHRPDMTDVRLPSAMYSSEVESIQHRMPRQNEIRIPDFYWRKWSYTSLSAKPAYQAVEYSNITLLDYEKFVFEELDRGSHIGDMLHFLFEILVFDKELLWDNSISKLLLHYGSQYEKFKPQLLQMISNVMHARISLHASSFSLSEIKSRDTIREMEFNFIFSATNRVDLIRILAELPGYFGLMEVAVLEGYFNGFIDLFFIHDGRYYILDWKSNFLGNKLEDYSSEKVEDAMNKNNYHLQYLIYTLAAHKYLQNKLTDYDYDNHFGGVIYIFLRGVRSHSDNGVFTTRISYSIIQKLEQLLAK